MNERVKIALAALELANRTGPLTIESTVLSDGTIEEKEQALYDLRCAIDARRQAVVHLATVVREEGYEKIPVVTFSAGRHAGRAGA
jgi:hypothetical protein